MSKVNIFVFRVVCIGLMSVFVFFSGCSNTSENGACIRGTGVKAGCGDDFTAGECDALSGTFYEGDSCSDLAYNSI